jgi:hypothetical protein
MSTWDVCAEPADCRGLAGTVIALHAGVAVLPWVADCNPWLAALLAGSCLAALPAALRAVPGRRCPLQGLRYTGGLWLARLADGGEAVAGVAAGTRVLPGLVFCRLSVGGRVRDWWVPRYALTASDFRRFKVALRCGRRETPPDC